MEFESRKTAIVALSCGGRKTETNTPQGKAPGWDPTDEVIAQEALRVSQLLNAPIYAQWEVAGCIHPIARERVTLIIEPSSDQRLDTRDVLLAASRKATAEERDTIALVAQRIHLVRAARCAQTIFHPRDVICFPVDAPFDPVSQYPWVRSELRFLLYEILVARPYYRLRGWM